VIGAAGADDGLLSGMGLGDHHRHGGGVGAVLAEDRPVGVADLGDEGFGQIDDHRSGAGHGVALLHAANIGGVDHRVVVAEQVGAIAAHEVDVAVAVGVPEVGALATGEELWIALGQVPDRLVAVHAAGDHRLGAFP